LRLGWFYDGLGLAQHTLLDKRRLLWVGEGTFIYRRLITRWVKGEMEWDGIGVIEGGWNYINVYGIIAEPRILMHESKESNPKCSKI
jgi:hypothetical protein